MHYGPTRPLLVNKFISDALNLKFFIIDLSGE